MKQTKTILLLLIALLPLQLFAKEAEEKADSGKLNITEIVLDHLSDAYEWHIANIDGKAVSVPLPVIVRSSAGNWFVGTAENLPEPFYFDAAHHGKIYERMADGTSQRPIDLSITKSVAQIWIVVALLLAVFLSCARWYKRRDMTSEAPGGFVGMIEATVMYIIDEVIRPSLPGKSFDRFAPYLLTVFFFILGCNLVGLIPVFPFGGNVTGNINITLFLAVCTMLAINLFGNKEYWKDIFWPKVPIFLKCPVPLIPAIEVFGIFTKPFALMIRLFANMMAGHAVILSFTCVIFVGWQMSALAGTNLTLFSVLMLLFMNLLELLVAFVQAYVFTILSAVFIGMANKEEE